MADNDEGFFNKEQTEYESADEMFSVLSEAVKGLEDVEALAVVYTEGTPIIVCSNGTQHDRVNTLLDLAKFSLMSSILEG